MTNSMIVVLNAWFIWFMVPNSTVHYTTGHAYASAEACEAALDEMARVGDWKELRCKTIFPAAKSE